jgi:CRP-like cAMP-binding protein
MAARTLSLDVRKQLHEIARPVVADKGEVLFRSGQVCEGAFLIQSGQVKLSLDTISNSYPPRTVSSGFVVGLPASFSGEPYSLTAEAKTACRLDFISRRSLLKALHENPKAGFEIVRILSDEIFKMRKAAKKAAVTRPSARIA